MIIPLCIYESRFDMGRPRVFNEDHVLRGVMKIFWRKGYMATSAEDLVKASGLGRGSLYNAFSNKETLFERALDYYLVHTREVASVLSDESSSAAVAIQTVLISTLESEALIKMGCLVTNTAIERAGHDKRISQILQRHFDLLRKALVLAIERGQANNEINSELNPTIAAELLLTVLQGLRVQAKSGTDSAILLQTIDQTLNLYRA
ncbi:TetR/AcrR family transcriptional regulator [Neptunomonas concharum]|uniref:TetR/AcrR family transcriptional regulator n=1 Tax=Neptunomonas concharum TaxID=1031538 RepID=A0A5P1R864_9GAMM|nr:TetR/AcrR family transcriptional regulator [Neptunomonas concharum]QEQ95465.1 TetR/AcrR family transcriptional regulator [Neptunomonas concharum]